MVTNDDEWNNRGTNNVRNLTVELNRAIGSCGSIKAQSKTDSTNKKIGTQSNWRELYATPAIGLIAFLQENC